MALNFPDNPSVNDVYRDSTSGFAYQWDGTVWQSYSDSSLGQIQVLDDISGSFNSSTQTFALTSSSTAITPANAQQIRVVLGGVVQDPADDYTVSGSNITFTTPPAGGLSFSGVVFGTAVPINTIVDGTVTEGSLRISTKAVVGAATTFTEDLVVNGSARVVGVLTVGTSSLTLNGDTNQINGVTISSGIITASSFSGDGSGLTGTGIGSTGDINTSGIITATKISAQEFEGFGDKLIFSPTATSFSPADGATGVNALSSPDISITYDQLMIFGSGNITLRKDSPTGTIAETYTVGVSTRATISNQTLTISPEGVAGDGNFDYDTEYYVVVPSESVKNAIAGSGASLTSYNFTTESGPVLSSVTPGFGATDVGLSTNITFTYDKNIRAGVGTITLRTVSAGGTITESYDVSSSGRLTFSTNTLTIDPTSDLKESTNHYVVVPDDAVAGYAGINTYEFTTKALALGDAYEGGYLICQASSVRWVVAPNTSEVTRTWYCRNDANTTAQSVSGCTGWFVPTCGQLQNPGYTCRTYWDSYSSARYWSSTEYSGSHVWGVFFSNGFTNSLDKTCTNCVRAFRCVSY